MRSCLIKYLPPFVLQFALMTPVSACAIRIEIKMRNVDHRVCLSDTMNKITTTTITQMIIIIMTNARTQNKLYIMRANKIRH